MRWLTAAFVMVAGTQICLLVQQQRAIAQVACLSDEVRDLRAALDHGSGPVVLAPEEHLVLDQLIASRLRGAASPQRNEAAPQPATARREAAQPAPAEPTGAQRAAAERATQMVDAALSNRTLRRDDVLELRRLLGQADPAAADELRRRIAAAINRDELVPTDPMAAIP